MVPPELAVGIGISPRGLARLDQRSKTIYLLAHKLSDKSHDKGADATQMDCISSEDRSRGATGLTR